jgi:hypothetical protein
LTASARTTSNGPPIRGPRHSRGSRQAHIVAAPPAFATKALCAVPKGSFFTQDKDVHTCHVRHPACDALWYRPCVSYILLYHEYEYFFDKKSISPPAPRGLRGVHDHMELDGRGSRNRKRGARLFGVIALMHAHACMLSNGVLFERHFNSPSSHHLIIIDCMKCHHGYGNIFDYESIKYTRCENRAT